MSLTRPRSCCGEGESQCPRARITSHRFNRGRSDHSERKSRYKCARDTDNIVVMARPLRMRARVLQVSSAAYQKEAARSHSSRAANAKRCLGRMNLTLFNGGKRPGCSKRRITCAERKFLCSIPHPLLKPSHEARVAKSEQGQSRGFYRRCHPRASRLRSARF